MNDVISLKLIKLGGFPGYFHPAGLALGWVHFNGEYN